MEEVLREFLSALRPSASGRSVWGDGTIHLTVDSYLCRSAPPREFVASARGVVCTTSGLAVFHNASGPHVLPGGRLERGESAREAFVREALEEVGCEIEIAGPIGFIHFCHETPKPASWGDYPYPDFLHRVYAARGECIDAAPADREVHRLEFVPPSKIDALPIEEAERIFIAAALDELARTT